MRSKILARRTSLRAAIALTLTCHALHASASPSQATVIARGKYLVKIIGCSDCHTPGGLTPKPDTKRYLGGSDVDFQVPGDGVFVPPNLTPDRETGLGSWTIAQIVKAITTGVNPTGRILSAAMPWPDYSNLTRPDAEAIAVYLKSVAAVNHKVPDPAASKPCVNKALECLVQREKAQP